LGILSKIDNQIDRIGETVIALHNPSQKVPKFSDQNLGALGHHVVSVTFPA
jgi:hypothetical protein